MASQLFFITRSYLPVLLLLIGLCFDHHYLLLTIDKEESSIPTEEAATTTTTDEIVNFLGGAKGHL